MYQNLYRHFLDSSKFKLHLAAHSHHHWLDSTMAAQSQYFIDSANLSDKKWDLIFSQKVPRLRELICKNLNAPTSQNIAFGANTHEFVFRLISCHLAEWIKTGTAMQILTTDSEFYSFERQARRMEELNAKVHRVPVEPFATFHERWAEACKKQNWSMIFFSHVFFNSGHVVDLAKMIEPAHAQSRMIVVDAYHSFMALPTDWKPYSESVYYLSGGYKYAQSGEGCCFLMTPQNQERPVYTGWFAEFGDLQNKQDGVPYPSDSFRFAGSTQDGSSMYRMIASLETLLANGLSVEKIHSYVSSLQTQFRNEVAALNHPLINEKTLLTSHAQNRGHFLAYDCGSSEAATNLQKKLYDKGLYCDCRANILRFGFGLYQTAPFDLKKYF